MHIYIYNYIYMIITFRLKFKFTLTFKMNITESETFATRRNFSDERHIKLLSVFNMEYFCIWVQTSVL